MRRMMTAIGLGLSAVLLTAGCQLVGGGGHDAKSSKPAQTTNSTGGQQAQTAPTAAPQPSAGTPPVSKQITMPIAGEQGKTYTLGFSSLLVKGQLAVLTLVWTPHGVGTDGVSLNDMAGGADPVPLFPGIALIDKTNLKRYVVVSDSEDNDLQSDTNQTSTGNNQPVTTTFWFAAPPANADLDVTLGSRPVFESVQVTR